MDSWAFLNELICLPLIGGGEDNLESILLISPVTDLSDPESPLQDAEMQIYNSFSGCRNGDLQLLRIQESRCSPWGMRYSLICPLVSRPNRIWFRIVWNA
jgi:hypothetical protein